MPRFPDFSLAGSDGRTHRLADYRGKPLVVFFYPKDMTSGCTVEACGFRDAYARLRKAGVAVVGVSPDPLARHQRFVEKESLNFPLLVDEEHRLAEQLGVWTEKSLYGRKFLGIVRTTYLVAADGTIARTWPKVKVAGHVDAVADAAITLAKDGTLPAPAAKPDRARTSAKPAKRAAR